MVVATSQLTGYGSHMAASVDHSANCRALLQLFALISRRRQPGTTQADISAATAIGMTRLQRLGGTWRAHEVCPPPDLAEIHELAGFAAPLLGLNRKVCALWLAGLADKRQAAQVKASVERLAKQAVERPARSIKDVELPNDLAALIKDNQR